MSTNRHVPLDGAANFREIGDLPTHHGRRLRAGVLFRSDELSRLSGHDIAQLDRLGLRLICDLRTPNERSARIARIGGGAQTRIVSIPFAHQSQDLTRAQLTWFLLRNARRLDFQQLLKGFYRTIAFERTAQISALFALLADERNLPALIHCSGGKDRTGFIAALIQLLAGVPREAVLADYLLTNRLLAPRQREFTRMIRWVSLFQISPQAIRSLLEARQEYLDETLDAVLETYGSIERYLIDGCGVTPAQLAQLREHLID